MAAAALDRVQRWMQAVVVNGGSVGEALASPEAAAEIERVEDVLLPSSRLTAAERVGIYHGMYLGRMGDALESDYPHLLRVLGAERFAALVRDYVQVHPSRSYTLNRLGDHLPEFILAAPRLRRRAFLHDLARVEQAVSQVFDAEETAPLSAEAIAAVPHEAWERARLQPVAAFRLLVLGHPVGPFLDGLEDRAKRPPFPRPRRSFMAVFRRNYVVRRLELAPAAHRLLAELAEGAALGAAVSRVAGRGGRSAAGADALFRWFREWVASGVFRSVAVEGGGPGRTRTFD
jgi:hypothetical protein